MKKENETGYRHWRVITTNIIDAEDQVIVA